MGSDTSMGRFTHTLNTKRGLSSNYLSDGQVGGRLMTQLAALKEESSIQISMLLSFFFQPEVGLIVLLENQVSINENCFISRLKQCMEIAFMLMQTLTEGAPNSQDSYTEKVVLKFFHQACWINALTSLPYVPKSKCNRKRPFCTEVSMQKEKVAPLRSTIDACCVFSLVPLSAQGG